MEIDAGSYYADTQLGGFCECESSHFASSVCTSIACGVEFCEMGVAKHDTWELYHWVVEPVNRAILIAVVAMGCL
jgi:hypothetical protein